ncbi:MAG: SIMPL domain-containing protein [Alphaproteobacteria bacterium]|nr:SIMPL domain-containing protein [Alphaproteobacteria bacterium]
MRMLSLPAAVAALAVAGAAFAADAPPTITVTGQGTVQAAPDEANFSTGVVSQAPTAAAALAANSRAMRAVFDTLHRVGIADKDIQTSDFAVSPQYQTCKPGVACAQRIVGYQVSNNVAVTVEDLTKAGGVLDALVASGSNQVGGIGFSIHDPKPLLAKARAEAVADAVDRATTIARAAGVALGAIQSIKEGGLAEPRPLYAMKAVMENSVPIAGGQETLSASVTITWVLK